LLGASSLAVYASEPERESFVEGPKRARKISTAKRRDTPAPFGSCDFDDSAFYSFEHMSHKKFDRFTTPASLNRETETASSYDLLSPAKEDPSYKRVLSYEDLRTGNTMLVPFFRTPSQGSEESVSDTVVAVITHALITSGSEAPPTTPSEASLAVGSDVVELPILGLTITK
jgi:hypothetical protein